MLSILVCCLCAAAAEPTASAGWEVVFMEDVADRMKEIKATRPLFKGGVLVVRVIPGGPAEKAGIKSFNIVRKIDKKEIRGRDDYDEWRQKASPGDQAAVEVYTLVDLRGGKSGWKQGQATMRLAARADVLTGEEVGPLVPVEAAICRNVINLPELSVTVRNDGRREIVACTISALCFNRFDEKVSDWSGTTNKFSGLSQRTLPTGESATWTWQLSQHANTARALVRIERVKFGDGSEWNVPEKRWHEIEARTKD